MSADWTETAEALALLAELDAAERSSDCYSGWGWSDVARSFAERCIEIEGELDDLRCDAVNALADATSDDRQSDDWLDAWTEADSEFETVEAACQRARRLHMGDGLIERAAAACPKKEIEVDLKAIGCPYSAEDARTLIWLAGFSKGEQAGMDAGAKIVSEVYDRALAGGAA